MTSYLGNLIESLFAFCEIVKNSTLCAIVPTIYFNATRMTFSMAIRTRSYRIISRVFATLRTRNDSVEIQDVIIILSAEMALLINVFLGLLIHTWIRVKKEPFSPVAKRVFLHTY